MKQKSKKKAKKLKHDLLKTLKKKKKEINNQNLKKN